METNKKAEEGTKGHIYVVDGKEWIIGEQKISMWSKAKCNQPIKIKEKDEKDKEKS